jgi:aspartate dehydrogenase
VTAEYSVAVCGLGAVGLEVARLDAGIPGLRLVAVAARNQAAARMRVASFRSLPPIVSLLGLAWTDVVVEAAPAAVFGSIAEVGIDAPERSSYPPPWTASYPE